MRWIHALSTLKSVGETDAKVVGGLFGKLTLEGVAIVVFHESTHFTAQAVKFSKFIAEHIGGIDVFSLAEEAKVHSVERLAIKLLTAVDETEATYA